MPSRRATCPRRQRDPRPAVVQLYPVRLLTGFGRVDADAHTQLSAAAVSLKPYVPECEARCVPPVPAKRRPILPRLAQLALSSGTVLSLPHPVLLFLSADVAPAPRHARASRSRCTIHLSTCTLSCTTCASRTYKRLPLTFSCLKRHPTRARSPRCSRARWRCSAPHGVTYSRRHCLPACYWRCTRCTRRECRARRGGAALDALGSVCVDAAALEALAHMRGEAPCRLEVASFESIAVIVRAVQLFPRLCWLRMPAVDYWHEHSPVTPAPVHLVRPSRQYMRLSVRSDGRVWGRANGSRCLRRCPSSRSSAACRSSAILRVPR